MLILQLLATGIFVGSIYALLGLSFATIFTSTRIWHFAQGAVYTVGAYAVLVASRAGFPFVFAILVAALVCAALGVACMKLLYIPLQARGATPLVTVMASLGVMTIVENLLLLYFGPSGYSIDVTVPEPLIVGDVFLTGGQYMAPVYSAVIVALYLFFLFKTPYGQRLRALIDNEELLLLNGVDTRRIKLLAFACGSALLPVALGLLVMTGAGVTPGVGISAVLIGAMAMFFGGVDSIEGAAVAGLILGIVESLTVYILPTEWQTATTYALVLIFLIIRPTGLFGRSLARTSL